MTLILKSRKSRLSDADLAADYAAGLSDDEMAAKRDLSASQIKARRIAVGLYRLPVGQVKTPRPATAPATPAPKADPFAYAASERRMCRNCSDYRAKGVTCPVRGQACTHVR